MGVKVVYEPKIGRYVVQEYLPFSTHGGPQGGYWSAILALHSIHPAREIANALQGSRPIPMYRVIDRGTNETE